MAFCSKCGAQVADGEKFCPSCGSAIEAAPVAPAAPAAPAAPTAPAADSNSAFAQLNNTADITAEFSEADINSNKAMAILAYFGILVLIPIFAAKESKYARFHASQGVNLFITTLAINIADTILNFIHLGFIGTLVSLLNLVVFVFCIIGIVNAANGKAKELPVIGGFRILK